MREQYEKDLNALNKLIEECEQLSSEKNFDEAIEKLNSAELREDFYKSVKRNYYKCLIATYLRAEKPDEAEAAIVVDNAPYGFGCIGCARTNEISIFLLRNKGIPVLELTYPTNQDETYVMVNKINEFVDSLEETSEEE